MIIENYLLGIVHKNLEEAEALIRISDEVGTACGSGERQSHQVQSWEEEGGGKPLSSWDRSWGV